MAVFADSVIVFVASLLIGAFGIYVGATVIADVDDFGKAVLTALIGAIVWALASFFLGVIPILGPILTLLAYIAVIKVIYNLQWLRAIAIALLAWIVAIGLLTVLRKMGLGSLKAVGIPRI